MFGGLGGLGGGGGAGGGGGGGGGAGWSKLKSKIRQGRLIGKLAAVKRRGRNGEGLLQRPELPPDFLRHKGSWVYFVETALIPGYRLQDFQVARAGCTLQSMQREVPISARAGLLSAQQPPSRPPSSGRGRHFDADNATADELLREVRSHEPRHYVPRLAQDGDNRALYVLLENMKEMAVLAEFGLADADDSMKTVRRFVTDLWRETNRLNAREASNLLSDMFYLAASLGPQEMHELVDHRSGLWALLIRKSRERPRLVFLETGRLALLPFHQVFVESDALRLAICHYVRSPLDVPTHSDEEHGGDSATDPDATRGGLSLRDVEALMEVCLVADKPLRDEFVGQVATMAGMAAPISAGPSLVVSTSHMDVHALAAIFSAFLAAWKGDDDPNHPRHAKIRLAELPEGSLSADCAIERLEKMSIVRQAVQRQVLVLEALYADVGGGGGGVSDSGVRRGTANLDGSAAGEWAGTVLSTYEHERLELFSMHMLLNAMAMEAVHETKHAIMGRGLVKASTLDTLFEQLNGVKQMLLGPRCERLLPPGAPPEPAATPRGGTKFGARRRAGGAADEADASEEKKWQLSVRVLAARNLRPGSSAIFARLRCLGYSYRTPQVYRTGSPPYAEAHFGGGQSTTYIANDVCGNGEETRLEVKLVETSAFAESALGRCEIAISGYKANKARQAEWHELRRGQRSVGEICLELQVKPYTERIGPDGKRRAASRPGHHRDGSRGSGSGGKSYREVLAEGEAEESLEFFTLSGEWQGFTWHAPMHTDRCYESSVQAMDMDLVFSAGNDIPAPHHAISGSGSDHIGNWELHSGRSYFRKPHSRKLYGRSAHTLFSTPLRARFGFFDQLASPRLATPRHASPRLATPCPARLHGVLMLRPGSTTTLPRPLLPSPFLFPLPSLRLPPLPPSRREARHRVGQDVHLAAGPLRELRRRRERHLRRARDLL